MVAAHRIVRVLSNNAVLATADDNDHEFVLVGRGIGFGRRPGDPVPPETATRRYVELSPDKAHYLHSIGSLDPHVAQTISAAVDLAEDLLGTLHPSVHVVLAEHLSFALQRVAGGSPITNPLLGEIRAVFPAEFGAAELIVRYLNTHVEVELPADEAAFVALHLNAARTGTTVKQPLATANELAGLVAFVRQRLARPADGAADDGLAATLSRTISRARAGHWRTNHAQRSIERDLAVESQLAHEILCRIVDAPELPRPAVGEAAFLAVFLHGWRQSTPTTHTTAPTTQPRRNLTRRTPS